MRGRWRFCPVSMVILRLSPYAVPGPKKHRYANISRTTSVQDCHPIEPAGVHELVARAAAADAEGRESHGLGLTFVRAILRRHGAEMMIDDAAPGAIVTAHFTR